MCQLVHRKRPRSSSPEAGASLRNGVKLRKVSAPTTTAASSLAGVTDYSSPPQAAANASVKQQLLESRCKMSPACCEPQEDNEDEYEEKIDEEEEQTKEDAKAEAHDCDNQIEEKEFATSVHRDEIVAAILTIASALGLARETLHLCVDVLDRFIAKHEVEASRLETLSIAQVHGDPDDDHRQVDQENPAAATTLGQHAAAHPFFSQWTWQQIIEVETEILKELNFRIMAPTTLGLLQKKIFGLDEPLAHEKVRYTSSPPQTIRSSSTRYSLAYLTVLSLNLQMQLAYYFADLFLLKDRSREFAKELLVEAIWYVISEHQITDVQPPLLAPVVLLFLAHRDNINPKHHVFKAWFALRCQYGAFLPAPWRVPYDPYCICRVCENVQDAQDELEELMESAAAPLLLSTKRSLNLV